MCLDVVQTLPYLKNRYETFEWAEVEKAVREKPAAYYKNITDDIKASLPFGLGKSKVPSFLSYSLILIVLIFMYIRNSPRLKKWRRRPSRSRRRRRQK